MKKSFAVFVHFQMTQFLKSLTQMISVQALLLAPLWARWLATRPPMMPVH
jgi:hypothetical protein